MWWDASGGQASACWNVCVDDVTCDHEPLDPHASTLRQAAITEAFAASTVLTIAHRLHTIVDADRVLVLEAGRIAEYAPPGELLATPGSTFRALASSAAAYQL